MIELVLDKHPFKGRCDGLWMTANPLSLSALRGEVYFPSFGILAGSVTAFTSAAWSKWHWQFWAQPPRGLDSFCFSPLATFTFEIQGPCSESSQLDEMCRDHGERGQLLRVCIFFMTNKPGHTFSFGYLLLWRLCSSFCPFFPPTGLPLSYWFVVLYLFIYLLWIHLFFFFWSHTFYGKYCLQSTKKFYLLNRVFCWKKVLNINLVQFINIFIYG